MSAADDGAGAPTSTRMDTGIETHGVTLAALLHRGQQIAPYGEWTEIEAATVSADLVIVRLVGGRSFRMGRNDWVKVRDILASYTNESEAP
jgi:hypothetical protein